jgi:hypothetical protein
MLFCHEDQQTRRTFVSSLGRGYARPPIDSIDLPLLKHVAILEGPCRLDGSQALLRLL